MESVPPEENIEHKSGISEEEDKTKHLPVK